MSKFSRHSLLKLDSMSGLKNVTKRSHRRFNPLSLRPIPAINFWSSKLGKRLCGSCPRADCYESDWRSIQTHPQDLRPTHGTCFNRFHLLFGYFYCLTCLPENCMPFYAGGGKTESKGGTGMTWYGTLQTTRTWTFITLNSVCVKPVTGRAKLRWPPIDSGCWWRKPLKNLTWIKLAER